MGHTVNKFSLITYNAEVKKWDTNKNIYSYLEKLY